MKRRQDAIGNEKRQNVTGRGRRQDDVGMERGRMQWEAKKCRRR